MIKRFDLASWRADPLSRRGLDLSGFDEQRTAVREIVRRVAAEGDAALREYGERFDGWKPGPGQGFELDRRELPAALARLPRADREALEFAARRIRDFHLRQSFEPDAGVGALRLLTRPVRRVGLYIPGGRAAYPSTVLMGAIPARVAGVREVLVATPPARDGSVPDAVLGAAAIAGVDAVYRVGGAQAIAAFAFGTATVPRVDLVAGPGNIYVTLAKREVFGSVGVDGIAGPTEIVVIADETADPRYVAADLSSQLEHDPLAFALLVTDSEKLARLVEREMESVNAAHCCVVLVDSIAEAIEVANDFAPEHLELLVEGAERWIAEIDNAGAVFVGPHTAVSLGDYVIGTNHTLPTAGAARFGSPLGVHTFLKRTSVAKLDQKDLESLQQAARALARLEGLPAHARAVEVRLGD